MEKIGMRNQDKSYTRRLYIDFSDTDRDGHVRLTTWLSWLAELAGDDYEERGLGRDQLIAEGKVFLISRFAFKLRRMPRAYETLSASTWENGTDTVFFNRDYRFVDERGLTVADARSIWLLCDPVRHRILRPAALNHPVNRLDIPLDCPSPEKLPLPEQDAVIGRRPIFYSDLDANDHVFCANYGRIVADALPAERLRPDLQSFEINYIKEAKLGETLTICGQDTDGAYLMAGLHEDGSACFAARIVTGSF